MSNCNPVTISKCPRQTDCESCKEIIKSFCIKYYGEDLEELGIEEGDTLNTILEKVQEAIANGGFTNENLFSDDLTLTANRTHNIGDFSFILQKPGEYSFSMNADLDEDIIGLPGLKFSGLTSLNSINGFTSFQGLIKNIPGVPNAIPITGITSNTKEITETFLIFESSPGQYSLLKNIAVVDNDTNTDVNIQITPNGDFWLQDVLSANEIKWRFTKEGKLFHTGEYVNSAIQIHDADVDGSDVTVLDNIDTLIYKTNGTVGSGNITLPLVDNGKVLHITALSGVGASGTAVTALTINGGIDPRMPSSLLDAAPFTIKYIQSENAWVRI